jgi:zinc and cadmium transporter
LTFPFIIGASLAGGLVSVLIASTVLAARPTLMERALPRLISFSTGSLLGAALLGMVPHAAETLSVSAVSLLVLLGFVFFFLLEKLLIWRHCHKHDCDVHAGSGPLLLIGDAVHNFVDGVVIAGAFLSDISLGVTVALSTVAHEVPQEIGEYMVYMSSGVSRRRALFLNATTSLTSVLGAVLGYFFLSELQKVGPFLLAFAAAGFIYVALADLIPAQRGKTSLSMSALDFLLLASGIGVIALFQSGH